MKIAQVAPLYESCPPRRYGGTERIVSFLTEELIRLGHDVTLFASGDSQTSARLEPCCAQALRLAGARDPLVHHMAMLHRVRQQVDDFDIIHFHTEYLHFPLFAEHSGKTLTTMHGRLDLPDLPIMFRDFATLPLVSISNAQQAPVCWANWYGTVLHGLPRDLHQAGDGGGGYLAFLGRVSPEKGPIAAIEIARRAGVPLQIAAKVDDADREFFESEIAPLLDDPLVEFIGEIGESEKNAFLGDAAALLFPVDWPEPFGLVLIEAMANGTPVIAFDRGSVAEIIEHGVTGFIVNDVAEATAAVPLARALDRQRIRDCFERRFTVERMARDYVTLYQRILADDSAEAIQPAHIGGCAPEDLAQAAE